MKYDQLISKLYSKPRGNIKPGLERTLELAAYFENPHLKYPTIHIAGTNGKGTTSSLIASALKEAGYNVGLYTSPHVLRFNERIRVNGTEIKDIELVDIYSGFYEKTEELSATFFEITTVLAFEHFARMEVDVAVLETGMGGRWDSTNICKPIACGITYIGLDHQEYLGETIEEIAKEKAGIIKENVPVYTYASGSGLSVIESVASLRNAEVKQCYIGLEKEQFQNGSLAVEYDNETHILRNYKFKNNTAFTSNFSLAVSILGNLGRQFIVNWANIVNGLENLERNTGFKARLEEHSINGVEVYLDIAHNADAIESQTDYLSKLYPEVKPVYIIGFMKDKDAYSIMGKILGASSVVFLYQPKTERAMSLDRLYTIVSEVREKAKMAEVIESRGGADAEEIFRMALDYAKNELAPLIITGSFHVAEEYIDLIERAR